VLDIDIQRPAFRNGWYYPAWPPTDIAPVDANRALINDVITRNNLAFVPDPGHEQRRDIQRHLVSRDVPLQLAYDELLSNYQVGNFEDDQKWIVAILLIDRYLARNPDAACTVFRMSHDRERRRQVRDGRILNLFQGAYPDTRGEVYPGDHRIVGADNLTIQIHNVTFTEGREAAAPVILQRVPIITLWMAQQLREDVVYQDQGGPPHP
jgi:hypothetical protein